MSPLRFIHCFAYWVIFLKRGGFHGPSTAKLSSASTALKSYPEGLCVSSRASSPCSSTQAGPLAHSIPTLGCLCCPLLKAYSPAKIMFKYPLLREACPDPFHTELTRSSSVTSLYCVNISVLRPIILDLPYLFKRLSPLLYYRLIENKDFIFFVCVALESSTLHSTG